MTSGTGNKSSGFTLIEVLVAVSIMAVGLASVLGGYRVLLDGYKKANLLMEGVSFLEERMTDREIEIRGSGLAGGSTVGNDGPWAWSTNVAGTERDGWYEIKGEVSREGGKGKISLFRYVRK